MALSRYCGVSIFVSILFIFISPPLLVRPVSTTPLLLHESGLEPFGVAPAPPTAHAGATPNGQRVGALLTPWLEEMESFYRANRRSKTRTSRFTVRTGGAKHVPPPATALEQSSSKQGLMVVRKAYHQTLHISNPPNQTTCTSPYPLKNHIYKLLFHNLVMDYSYSGNKKSITVITHFLKLGFYDHGA